MTDPDPVEHKQMDPVGKNYDHWNWKWRFHIIKILWWCRGGGHLAVGKTIKMGMQEGKKSWRKRGKFHITRLKSLACFLGYVLLRWGNNNLKGHGRKIIEVHNILCVQEVVTILYSNLLYKMRHYSWTYTVRPGSSDSFFIASILYKMGHFFLDILYTPKILCRRDW